jgi:hypothetical protein
MTIEVTNGIARFCLVFLVILVAIGYLAEEGYIFSHEVESYDAVFEVVDANSTAIYTKNVGTNIYHTLSIRSVDNPTKNYNVSVTADEYKQCGIGRLAIFEIKNVKTVFGKNIEIVTFQSVK